MADVKVNLDVSGITRQVAEAAHKAIIYDVATQVLAEVKKSNAFYDDQSGELRASFRLVKIMDGFRYRIESRNPHAWYLEKGHLLTAWGNRTEKHIKGRYPLRRARNKIMRRMKDILSDYSIFISKGSGVYIRKQRKAK